MFEGDPRDWDAKAWKKVSVMARRIAPPEIPVNLREDFISYVSQSILKRNKLPDIFYLKKDFIRDHFDIVYPMNRIKEADLPPSESEEDSVTIKDSINVILMRVNQKLRTVFVLRNLWGLSLKEIGFVLGVSESQAHHILAAAERYIKRRVNIQKKK